MSVCVLISVCELMSAVLRLCVVLGYKCVRSLYGDTDEGIQTDMLDNPPSDNFESPPVVLPTRAQPDPMQDDSDGGLGGEDVQLFPELKIRGNPKHLASPIKHFNACQKNVVLALGLGDILDFQVEGYLGLCSLGCNCVRSYELDSTVHAF
nr:beta-D-glucosyl crocetin beta-1,6-glucosyltransferase-like [Ipomoea batatas]